MATIPHTYIVTLHDTAISQDVRNEHDFNKRHEMMLPEVKVLFAQSGIPCQVLRVFAGIFWGCVVECDEEVIDTLKNMGYVKAVEQDQIISIHPPKE
jgi:hypothetical protein